VFWAETILEGNAIGRMTINEKATIKRIALVRFTEFTERSFCNVMPAYLFTFSENRSADWKKAGLQGFERKWTQQWKGFVAIE
jgi:hypothetical protein